MIYSNPFKTQLNPKLFFQRVIRNNKGHSQDYDLSNGLRPKMQIQANIIMEYRLTNSCCKISLSWVLSLFSFVSFEIVTSACDEVHKT